MSEQKQYADRDIMDLDEKGGYYFRHVDAMTREGLHSKSDIAAELGHRDMLIDTYREMCVEMLEAMKKTVATWDLIYPDMKNESLGQDALEDTEFTEIMAMRRSITKAESILGEKNGTSN